MSYSIETYDKAQSILDRRKEKATLEAQDRATALHRHTIRFWQSQRKPVQLLFLLNVRVKHIK